MTDYKQAENANAWLFASIVEACPGFLYFIDDAGNILISNHVFQEKIKEHPKKINHAEIAKALDFNEHEIDMILEDDYSGFFKEGRWETDFLNERDGKAPRYFKIYRQAIKEADQIKVVGLLVVIQEQERFIDVKTTPKEPKVEIKLERAPRVLVVEDYVVASKYNRLMFKRNHCEVDVAENEKEALALFDANTYDLVMMDWMLPGSPGYYVTKQIRKKEALEGRKKVPVIALTTKEAENILEDCKKYQMNGYIHKPMSGKQASQLIERFVFNKDVEVDNMIAIGLE